MFSSSVNSARAAYNFSLRLFNNYLILATLSELTFPSYPNSTKTERSGANSPALPAFVA